MKKSPLVFFLKRIFIAVSGILLCVNGFAQTPLIAVDINPVNTTTPAAVGTATIRNGSGVAKEGTYQILHIKGKPEDVVPQSMLDLIESYRTENHIIYMKVGDNTWIKILPYNEILDPNFRPIPNRADTDESLIEN